MCKAANIIITEKPDWVSWDDIKQCLVDAHAVNRAKGIETSLYKWPTDKIQQSIEPYGVMLVALDNGKVVGTAALRVKHSKRWFAKGRYAYLCFWAVLPEYNGLGIHTELVRKSEEIAKQRNYSVFVFDTNEHNKKVINKSRANGYRYVAYYRPNNTDHYNVIMAKWPNACPYSKAYCKARFCISWLKVRLSACFNRK
ncbi:MAG: GNAT family N-acetyltransferase [Muribaculaceae bacterium]|nr:GNAT family N-acetyltransferase [Muribaculaceae bacterium]